MNTGGNRLRNLSECRVGMVGNKIQPVSNKHGNHKIGTPDFPAAR